jgi:hypothetical protein
MSILTHAALNLTRLLPGGCHCCGGDGWMGSQPCTVCGGSGSCGGGR